jgi:hypothetical protein
MAKKSALSLVPAVTTIAPERPIHPNCPPSEAEITSAKNFERALGGRLHLIEELASSPDLTPDLDKLLPILGDPANDTKPLALICHSVGLRPGDLFRVFKEATIARANILAIQQAADALPTIMADVLEQSVSKIETCPKCQGSGSLTLPPTDQRPVAIPYDCPICNGKGEVRVMADLDRQKMVFEMTGLLKKSGIAVGITNNTQINNPGAGGNAQVSGGLESLQQAIAQTLHGVDRRPDLESEAPAPASPGPDDPAASTVDAEVIPDEEPA